MAALSDSDYLEFRSEMVSDPELCGLYNGRCNRLYKEYFDAHMKTLPRDDNRNVIPPGDQYWQQRFSGYIAIDIYWNDGKLRDHVSARHRDLSARQRKQRHEEICLLFGKTTFDYHRQERQRGRWLCPTGCPA